jgi:hypothetical protein
VDGVVAGPSSPRPGRAVALEGGPRLQVRDEACEGRRPSGSQVGFPLDFLGSHSFPHLASRLSRLWSLPCSSRESFCGGWFSSPFRPLSLGEEWPLPGRSGESALMDSKNRNPNWDRWGPKEAPQGSQSWGKNRNLSWRLKTGSGKSEVKDDIPVSTPGDAGLPGILKTPPPPILKSENDLVCRVFCQKCGLDGHHARECFKSLWCEICRKETHNTARCVLPKQNKPSMPIVGMAADGLGFYSSHFAKPLSNKPKRSFIGLVKIVEGLITADDLEKDFGFHFPWGRAWKATKCHSGFLMQFPSQERLDEMINFRELKMKLSGAKISVSSWSSQAKPKSKLHSVWIVAENVPEELQNYQAICELGSTIGAVEEVDINSLNSKEIVRFKVHVKSVAMIPPIIEVGVKPFLYDIYFKIDNITDEGWNDDSVNLGKRASVDRQGFGEISLGKYAKKAKSGDEDSGKDIKGKSPLKIPSSQVNVAGSLSEQSESMKMGKGSEDPKGYLDSQGNEDEEFNDSEDDLLDSQELDEFIKDDDFIPSPAQDKKKLHMSIVEDASKTAGGKKCGTMEIEASEGVRRSSRLESSEEVKIADKAAARAMAKDAFINKGMSCNPFSVLNTDNDVLFDVANKLGVELGSSFNDAVENLNLIKSLELSRKNLVVQSVRINVDNSNADCIVSDDDNTMHKDNLEDNFSDLEDVMILRKGRKIQHRKKTVRKKNNSILAGKSPNNRKIPIKRKGQLVGQPPICSE